MTISRKKAAIIAAILFVFAAMSFFWISGYASNPDNFQGTLGSLEDKSSTVMELTAGSTALSAAITLIPGDIGTPIAEKLADLSGYFVFILAAIYVEKWLVTITGLVAFKYIIPLCLLGLAAVVFFANESIRGIFIKLICFALIAFALVPTSVVLSDMIYDNYQATIQQTIDDAKKSEEDLQKKNEKGDDENIAKKIVNNVTSSMTAKAEEFRAILNGYVEATAVLIVTSCAIPLAVLAFYIWIIKLLTGIDLNVPRPRFSRVIGRH